MSAVCVNAADGIKRRTGLVPRVPHRNCQVPGPVVSGFLPQKLERPEIRWFAVCYEGGKIPPCVFRHISASVQSIDKEGNSCRRRAWRKRCRTNSAPGN